MFIRNRLYFLGLALLTWSLNSCQSETPLPEPEEELNFVEDEPENLPENNYQQYVEEESPPAIPAPTPPSTPAAPTWQYGYQEGSFSGNVYTPGVYNFGSEATQGAQVFYARQCDCVYAQSNGEIIGIVTRGDHPLVYPGKDIVKLTDGAMMRPAALVQDPLARQQRENAWR